MSFNRRKFIYGSAVTAAGLLIGNRLKGMIGSGNPGVDEGVTLSSKPGKYDLMAEVMKYRKIDAHAHNYFTKDSPGQQLDFGERLGIEKQVISRYLSVIPGTPEQFREYNDLTIKDIKKYPNHLLGGLVLNPTYKKESLEEIERCADAGMIGTGELYYQVKINDPL